MSARETRSEEAPPLPEAEGIAHSAVALPGLRVHLAAIGEGDPVLMLHGFPEHWWQWREIAPRVAGEGFRVLCPDLRGSGWTEAENGGFDRHTMLRDVIALLDALDIPTIDVVAHDLGAVVATQLAYAHPERVRSLVLLAVPPGFMRFSPRLLPAFTHMPAMLAHREGGSLEWLLGDRYAAHRIPPEVIDGYLRAQRRPEVTRAVRALYRGMIVPEAVALARGDYRRQRLAPPTLAVFGRNDRPFPEPLVRRICRDHERRAAHFDLAFVDDAAHFLTDDAPDAVADLAIGWIRGDR